MDMLRLLCLQTLPDKEIKLRNKKWVKCSYKPELYPLLKERRGRGGRLERMVVGVTAVPSSHANSVERKRVEEANSLTALLIESIQVRDRSLGQ